MVPSGDSVRGIAVKFGDQMPDWKRWELIKKFRSEMEQDNLVVSQVSGTELHGYSQTRRSI